MIIRDATPEDVPALTRLYNAWIPTRTITWTEEPATEARRRDWLERQTLEGLPVLVADEGGAVLGFAAYEYFRGEGKWPGYRLTMEQSIHVDEVAWGRGVGRALIEALLGRARAAGVHVMVAGIDSENVESLRFHERLGFIEVARMPQIGVKFGRWLDLVLVQRILDDRAAP